MIISTLPPGASITTVTSGSATDSFYVFTTTSASASDGVSTPTGSCTQEICFTCGLLPVVTTTCGDPTGLTPTTNVGPTSAASTMLITSDGVTYTSVGYMAPTSSPSVTAVAACPTETASLCASANKEETCGSARGFIYELACGVIVLGTEILDSLVNLLDKRVVVADFGSCLAACDNTASCVAVNYVDTNCTLFSSVSGTSLQAGAVSATQVGVGGGGGSTTMTITSYNGFCPSLTASGTGTTTVYNTFTVTSCAAQPICPNPGYAIVGGSATVPGGVVVTTTNNQGNPITYTQIQTSDIPITTTNSNGVTVVYTQTAAPVYGGGGAGTGPGTGFNTITETTTNSNGMTEYITITPVGAGTGAGKQLSSVKASSEHSKLCLILEIP